MQILDTTTVVFNTPKLTLPNSPNLYILKLTSPNSPNFNIPKLTYLTHPTCII